MTWTPDRPTKPGNSIELSWLKLSERLPPFDEGLRVLIYTEGVEFNGAQFFDVTADSLYGHPDEMEEAQRHATHWMPLTALRREYVEPADPFAEPVPSLRSRVEALPRWDPSGPDERREIAHMEASPDGDYLDRSEVLALLDEVTR